MKTKIQIESIFEKLLFEIETKNNSIKKTIEEAIRQKVDLSGADLRGADLSDANLSGVKNKETAYVPIGSL